MSCLYDIFRRGWWSKDPFLHVCTNVMLKKMFLLILSRHILLVLHYFVVEDGKILTYSTNFKIQVV